MKSILGARAYLMKGTRTRSTDVFLESQTEDGRDKLSESFKQAVRVCRKRLKMCSCFSSRHQRLYRQHQLMMNSSHSFNGYEGSVGYEEWRNEFFNSVTSLPYFDANQDERSELGNLNDMFYFDTFDEFWSDENKENFIKEHKHDGSCINPRADLTRRSSLLRRDTIDKNFDAIANNEMKWMDGFPGRLTHAEVDAVLKFKYKLQHNNNKMYWNMATHFVDIEGEAFALCRFLRARKFNVDDTIEMMSEHIDLWKEASLNNFYPDIENDIGIKFSSLLTQYPFLYMGNARDGYPVCYFEAGKMSIDGMLCIGTIGQIQKVLWHISAYTTKRQFEMWRERDGKSFIPILEQITIINLEGMSKSFFSKQNINMLKELNLVLQSFPEMLHRCVIVNAPSFFSCAWLLIQHLIDKDTAKRIVIFSDKTAAEKYLLELIDENELASNFGGKNRSIEDTIIKAGPYGKLMTKQVSKLLDLKIRSTTNRVFYGFKISKAEKIKMSLYTRCPCNVVFTLRRVQDGQIIRSMELVNPLIRNQIDSLDENNTLNNDVFNGEDQPYCTDFLTDFRLEGEYELHGEMKMFNKAYSEHVLLVLDFSQQV